MVLGFETDSSITSLPYTKSNSPTLNLVHALIFVKQYELNLITDFKSAVYIYSNLSNPTAILALHAPYTYYEQNFFPHTEHL